MNLRDLKKLVKHGETDNVEFKEATGQIDRAVETLCAFLNKNGGTVLLGIKDNGDIVGQVVNDDVKRKIANNLNRIEPHPDIKTEFIPVSKKEVVIALIANPGTNGPYVCNGKPYVRVQSTTKVMPQDEYKRILSANMPMASWEELTSSTCTLNDLDHNRIKEVVRMAVLEKRLPESAMTTTVPNILKKFDLTIDGKLTNAAVVLFCKSEQKQFRQSNLKLARFRGIDKREFLDTKMFRANAFDLYDKAMDFLTFSLPVGARIEPGNPNRVEEPAIPYNVLREAITNALIHRDYSHKGGSIDIAIYDDRVNISNIGSLPKGVLLSQLSKEHSSIQRNPLIAHVFYLCGKIEKWGRGTIDMIQDCKQAGNPPPKYAEVGDSFSVTLPLKEPMRSITLEIPRIDLDALTDRQKEIVKILLKGTMSTEQIISKMKKPPTSRMVQLELSKLKKLGVIATADKERGRSVLWRLNAK